MRHVLHSIRQLALWQKAVLGIMILIILLTWLALCLVLTGYWGL